MTHPTPDEEVRELEAAFADNPAAQKLRELVMDYAQRHGGKTYESIRLFFSPFWGDITFSSMTEIAARLGVDELELQAIVDAMFNEIRPVWIASPEYKASKKRRGNK